MIDYEIRVSLQDTRPADCLDGNPYCAIVMGFIRGQDKNHGWYNTGTVIWAPSAEEAFLLALEKHNTNKTIKT